MNCCTFSAKRRTRGEIARERGLEPLANLILEDRSVVPSVVAAPFVVGEVTDVVEKEMYTFNDRGGENLSLRPELTAGVVRAGIERVVDQLAHHRGRALDHLAGGDLADQLVGQFADRTARRGGRGREPGVGQGMDAGAGIHPRIVGGRPDCRFCHPETG